MSVGVHVLVLLSDGVSVSAHKSVSVCVHVSACASVPLSVSRVCECVSVYELHCECVVPTCGCERAGVCQHVWVFWHSRLCVSMCV